MPDFLHGMRFNDIVEGVRPAVASSSAVIGLVGTADAVGVDAKAALDLAFPLDRPVLVTDALAASADAGTSGTLAKALAAIAAQGSPIVVVVRVAVAADAAGQATAAIGGVVGGAYTGMQALLAAEGQLGVRPTILGVPGLDQASVTEALASVARRLRGFVYAAARTGAALAADVSEALAARETFPDREVMLLWPEATGWDGQAVATALGLRAMIDEQTGWHKSLSNVAVQGVTGTTHDVHFDIRDQSSDAGLLNAGEVTTIVRMTGYRFWGNRTCSTDSAWAFEVAVRTAQALQDGIAAIEAPYIDQPLTAGLVRQMEEEGAAYLRRLKTEGRIVGGSCYFDGTANPGEQLAAGRLVIEASYTPAAPLEGLVTNLRITTAGYDDFADQVAAASASAA